MQTAELSDRQRNTVLGKIEPNVERITRSSLSEQQKLRSIGLLVQGEITSALAVRYAEEPGSVQPSVLPRHDDATIEHLAKWQRTMRKSHLPAAVQAEMLDQLELIELRMQRDDRMPKKPTYFDLTDDEPHTSYHFDN